MSTKNDTLKRREKVYSFFLMGMPQSEMAKKLHVSRSTIARTISELRHELGNRTLDMVENRWKKCCIRVLILRLSLKKQQSQNKV